MCIEERCNIRAGYNFEGKKPLYCLTHKKEGMIDVKHPRCIEEGCVNRARYSRETMKPKYCFIHKKERMINVDKIKSMKDD